METADVPEDACLAAWCAGDEWCAVACAAEAIGRKWHPVIVHRLLSRGPLRFNELADGVEGLTNKVLSESLEDLADNGLVERRVVEEKPVAVEYALTERGASLRPVVEALEAWGQDRLGREAGDAADGDRRTD
ncbi:MAG: winged helix-turn-helix transcriptional regulator [Haloferacaceae archaeon]